MNIIKKSHTQKTKILITWEEFVSAAVEKLKEKYGLSFEGTLLIPYEKDTNPEFMKTSSDGESSICEFPDRVYLAIRDKNEPKPDYSNEIIYRCEKCGSRMTDIGETMVCDNQSCGWNESTHCDASCSHEHLCVGRNCKRDDKDGTPMPHNCQENKCNSLKHQ